jgi:nucleoside recognition membrane protein YjiH
VLTIGTLATIVVEYTSIVSHLSMPLGWLVGLLGLPEAAAAGESILLGFVDVFLPFITGGAIVAPITKFVIAVVCVLQIIYITETGPLLLKIKLGLKFHHIVIIFLMRTVMALLLATPVAYLLF